MNFNEDNNKLLIKSEMRKYIEEIIKETEKKLKITDMEDWYRVSVRQLQELGFDYLLTSKNGSLYLHRP